MSTNLLYAALAALLLDAATTLYMLRIGGIEANPMMGALMRSTNPLIALCVTHSLLAVLFILKWSAFGLVLQTGIAAVWWGIVAWNIAQITRQRRTGV